VEKASFSDVIVAQHQLVLRRMDTLRRGARLQGDAGRLAIVLLAHTIAEHEIVDPLETDRSQRARDHSEHDLLTYALSRVLDSPAVAHMFEARLHTLRTLLVHHCEREERARLPALERHVGQSRSRLIGGRLTERFAALEALDLESLVASAGSLSAGGARRRR
jgi:hypothetical protein